jgi:hypothetical protein
VPLNSPGCSKTLAPTIAALAFSAGAVFGLASGGDSHGGAGRQTESRTGLVENTEVRIERITP